MSNKICSYNVEWFDNLFDNDNQLSNVINNQKRLNSIAKVLKKVDADLFAIIEAPNTKPDGNKNTESCLKNFAAHYKLRTKDVVTGFKSKGKQEIAILFDSTKLEVSHQPGGNTSHCPAFTERFEFDTDEDRIKEVYKFYRPPLEAKVKDITTGESFHLLVVHTKSKGIFSSSDMAHWEKENFRNRRKLIAECTWIRKRIDEWLAEGYSVVVVGDFNDGPGMDNYEF